jgi:hypothetical protein
MTDPNLIATPADVDALTPGQWVWAGDDTAWCLVDTCAGWPQRMWMANEQRGFNVALDQIPYPLALTAPEGPPCEHSWGVQECGHCKRCGAVVVNAVEGGGGS